MNVRSHNAEVEAFLDILSGCYAHLIYNDLYGKAVEIAMDDGNTSATDAFRNILTQYSRGTENSERCVQLLQYINKYHNRHHKYIGVVDLEKRFIRTFWPGDTEQLSKSQRNSAVANILRKTIKNAIGVALEPDQVKNIIDRHSSQSSMEALQDRIVGCCFIVRESYHTRFARKEGGVDDSVPGEVVSKLTKRLNAALEENKTLKSELEASKRIMRLLAIRTKEAEAAIEQRDIEIGELRRGQNGRRSISNGHAVMNGQTSVTSTRALTSARANTSASALTSARARTVASASPSSLPFNRIVQSPPTTDAPDRGAEKLGFSPIVRSPSGVTNAVVSRKSTAPRAPRSGKKTKAILNQSVDEEEAQGLTALAETIQDVKEDVENYLMSPHIDDDSDFIGMGHETNSAIMEYEDEENNSAISPASHDTPSSLDSAIDNVISNATSKNYFSTEIDDSY